MKASIGFVFLPLNLGDTQRKYQLRKCNTSSNKLQHEEIFIDSHIFDDKKSRYTLNRDNSIGPYIQNFSNAGRQTRRFVDLF